MQNAPPPLMIGDGCRVDIFTADNLRGQTGSFQIASQQWIGGGRLKQKLAAMTCSACQLVDQQQRIHHADDGRFKNMKLIEGELLIAGGQRAIKLVRRIAGLALPPIKEL